MIGRNFREKSGHDRPDNATEQLNESRALGQAHHSKPKGIAPTKGRAISITADLAAFSAP